MKNIKSFILSIYKKYFVVVYFVGIIILIPSGLSWAKRILFFLFSFLTFLIIYSIFKKLDDKKEILRSENLQEYNKFFFLLLIFSLLFLLITRLIPFFRFGEAPLGYDTGFYLEQFAYSLDSSYFQSSVFFYLNLVPLHLLGLTPLLTIHFMYILSQFLIAGSLYILFRSFRGKFSLAFASLAVFLFSISLLQFHAYWWMFGRQMLATGFFFLTIALFFQRPVLATLTASMGILFHPPTFIIFVLSFLLFLLIQISRSFFQRKFLDRRLFIFSVIGLGIFFIVVSFQMSNFLGYINRYILQYKGLATNFPSWQISQMKGLFINISRFRLMSLFLVPFALFGFLQPRIWMQAFKLSKPLSDFIIFIYIMFLGLFLLISFPVIYQHRFIILFDLLLIIFSVPPLFLLVNYFLLNRSGRVLLGIFLIPCFISVGTFAWAQRPHITPGELKEIKAITSFTEPNAIVIATNSYYAPWVIGFSGRLSIAPGLSFDHWNLSKWMTFWQGRDDKERHELLREYISYPIYFFIGEVEPRNSAYYIFVQTDPHFTQISSHIWKYNSDL